MDNYSNTTTSAKSEPDPITTGGGGQPLIPPRPKHRAERSTGLASSSNVITSRPLICATYLMNDIPRGTSRIKLSNYLLRSPHRQNQASSGSQPHVICGVTMADSRLDDELNVARIEFSDTPMWLQDLNDDPDGFPKKTALGTLWRGVDIETGEPDDSGQTELIRATRRGDLLYAEMLAEFEDTNVNILDNKGRTALHWACAGGHALLVQLCLSVTTSDIGLRDEDGLTAFIIALEHDRSETIPNLFYRNMIELDEIDPQAALLRVLTVTADPASTVDRPIFPGQAIFDPVHDQNLLLVSALVNRGVDLTARDLDGNTALHVAVAVGNVEIAVRLLEGGSEVNAVDFNEATPLHHAARTGIRMVEALLDWKADTAAKDKDEKSVSDWALQSGQVAVAQLIRDHELGVIDGLEVERPALPLGHERDEINVPHGLIYNMEHLELARVGVEAREEELGWKKQLGGLPAVEEREVSGRLQDVGEPKEGRVSRSLKEACVLGDVATVRQRLKDGAEVNNHDERRGSLLCAAAKNGQLEIVQLLLAAGADIQAVDYLKWTVLHYAARGGHTETVQALLAAGADIHVADSSKLTVLHSAARGGHTETARTLLAAGVDIHAVDYMKWTVLHSAARGGHTETVQALLAPGADIKEVNNKKWTPLHLAARHGRTDTVTALLLSGAEIDKRGSGGTALQLAKKYHHWGTVGILLDAGAAREPSSLRDVLLDPLRRWN